MVFRQVNLKYPAINKIDWHPLSTDHLVVLYKRPYLHVINYIKDFSYPELEIDIGSVSDELYEVVEFADFQFGVGTLEYTFYLFLLADNGKIYCLHPVLIDCVSMEEFMFL